MINKTWVSSTGKRLAMALFFIIATLAWIVAHTTHKHVTGKADELGVTSNNQYVTGAMNGVRLRIPKNYILGPAQYKKGEGSRAPIAGDWPPIDEFGILVRFENFEPIRSDKDRADWDFALSKARPSFEEYWLMIDFDARVPINAKENIMKSMREDIPHWGPFVLDKGTPYGLTHYESAQTIDSSPIHGHEEYFFDDASPTSIECETSRIKVPPFDTQDHCDQLFFVPALKVMAKAMYTKNDLPRWKEIERQTQRIAAGFVDK